MSFNVNDILRVKSFFRQGANEALMISYWQLIDIIEPGTNTDFAQAFQKDLIAEGELTEILHTTASYYKTVVDSIAEIPEYGEYNEIVAGEATGDPAPPFVAISIKQQVGTRATRAGYKRVPFVSETHINGLVHAVPTLTVIALQDWFGTEHTISTVVDLESKSWTIAPIVMGRTLVPETDPPVYVEDPTRINYVTGALVQKPTSQTSRKV